MKCIHKLLPMTCAILCAIPAVQALTLTPDDAALALRTKELNQRKSELQQQIAIEDAKRNRQINGVSPETQERLNDRQDSVCLELRSQLVAVNLELRELAPDQAATTLATQLNQLTQQSTLQTQQTGQREAAE